MTVYVVSSRTYEDTGVSFVASSLEKAIELVKASYPAPYIVQWDEPATDSWGCTSLTGHFAAVPNVTTKHAATFDFSAYVVDTL